MSDLSLARRAAIPAEWLIHLPSHPREGWEEAIGPHARFYLDRHNLFRRLTSVLIEETQAELDAAGPPGRHAQIVSHYGGALLGELHTHHQVEDHHYFPRLIEVEPRAQRGFDLLEQDHEEMDGILAEIDRAGGAVLSALPGDRAAAAAFLRTMTEAQRLLLLAHGEHAALD